MRWLWMVPAIPVSVVAGAIIVGAVGPFFCSDTPCDSRFEKLVQAAIGASMGGFVLIPVFTIAIVNKVWPIFAEVMGSALGIIILPLIVYLVQGFDRFLEESFIATALVIILAGFSGAALGALAYMAVRRWIPVGPENA